MPRPFAAWQEEVALCQSLQTGDHLQDRMQVPASRAQNHITLDILSSPKTFPAAWLQPTSIAGRVFCPTQSGPAFLMCCMNLSHLQPRPRPNARTAQPRRLLLSAPGLVWSSSRLILPASQLAVLVLLTAQGMKKLKAKSCAAIEFR